MIGKARVQVQSYVDNGEEFVRCKYSNGKRNLDRRILSDMERYIPLRSQENNEVEDPLNK